ncbi:GyrI-like domain-containing protein, partial [Acrocarpospora phusangensis]|uniref:GyrI-like domain-containing protein n=1 Tax=Acrocarpospora phusangensis TaxID=1070424 RepID=UPI00194FF77F
DYYQAAATSAATPEGMTSLAVPAGMWAVFENSGPFPHSIQYLWRDVYTQWFPSNPYQSRPGPTLLSTRVSADGTEADAQLWIPVEPAPEAGVTSP